MSRQIGLIKLKGNIGDISFYKSDGVNLARMANGPSRERILNDPSFLRTRENNVEFGGCATAAKALRMALINVIRSKCDARSTGRLTSLFKQINLKSDGVRGQRSITLSGHKELLEGFNFNRRTNLSQVFTAPYSVTHNDDRNSCSLVTGSFIPGNCISAPTGASHFRMFAAMGVVSDYVFDVNTGSYVPTDPLLNMIGSITYSDYNDLSVAGETSISIDVALPGATPPVMTDTVSVVQCIGIEFYQVIASAYYILAQHNCMKIEKVF